MRPSSSSGGRRQYFHHARVETTISSKWPSSDSVKKKVNEFEKEILQEAQQLLKLHEVSIGNKAKSRLKFDKNSSSAMKINPIPITHLGKPQALDNLQLSSEMKARMDQLQDLDRVYVDTWGRFRMVAMLWKKNLNTKLLYNASNHIDIMVKWQCTDVYMLYGSPKKESISPHGGIARMAMAPSKKGSIDSMLT
ncbi:hypothetical protein Cgig2_011317 [Carnegiea gigantea]|uniref:Uncharacterized protein n=1 Tax=Carnegiea gigantea TaxID=171969 RepID=A0A9Q1GS45_9CARY|nr:hypothetical protein Cgig2_011317 [Carnegiea gigantea]